MKVFFLARFNLEIEIAEQVQKVKCGEIFYLDDIPTALIFVRDLNGVGYSFYFENCLNNELSFAKLRKLGKDYLIELKPNMQFLPTEIQKKVIAFDENLFLVEIYNSKFIQLHTTKQTHNLSYDNFQSFNYYTKIIEKKLLFLVFNYINKSYYYIFDNTGLMFKGFVKEINIKDNKLIILQDDVSCYGQKRVVEFDLNSGEVEKYFVFADDRKVFKNINVLYLFLDAVKIKNYALCKEYLSTDLCDIDEESFFDYFEDFDNYFFIENCCVLEKNNEVMKIIHFEVFNNKIVNIYD